MQFKIRQLWTLLFFFTLTIILYHKGYGSQFLDDFFTILVYFRQQGWKGLGDSFGFTSLYYGHNLAVLGFYSLFGMNKLAWFLLFTGLHSLNAFLGFTFFSRLLQNNNVRHASLIAFLGSLLFLTDPYQTENVIWGATLHYAISFLCLWTCMILISAHLQSGRWPHLLLAHVLFAFSLITLEISLVFPGIFFIVFTFLWKPHYDFDRLKQVAVKIVLPNTCIILFYFLATKLLKGHFIGHYGSETHLANLDLSSLSAAFLKYLIKLIFYIHHFSYGFRSAVYEFFSVHQKFSFIVFSSLLIFSLVTLALNKRKAFLISALFLITFLILLPVLNMYFSYLLPIENERLSYMASYFISLAVILLLSFGGKYVMLVLSSALILISSYLVNISTEAWKGASLTQATAVNSFRWEGFDRIFVLNQPCYFQGAYVFRNKTRLNRALFMMRGIDLQTNIQEIAWTTMNSFEDSVLVEKINERTFKVSLPQWGRWFWYNNLGATDYENEFCKVDFADDSQSYVVEFENLSSADAVIYFTSGGWKEILIK